MPVYDSYGGVDLSGGKDVLRELNSEGYVDFFFSLRDDFEGAMVGRDETFRRKSVVAKALLNLQPELLGVVEQIWKQLTER